jgi:hypothetical protein
MRALARPSSGTTLTADTRFYASTPFALRHKVGIVVAEAMPQGAGRTVISGDRCQRIDSGGDPRAELEEEREAPTVVDLIARFEREQLPKRRPSTSLHANATTQAVEGNLVDFCVCGAFRRRYAV